MFLLRYWLGFYRKSPTERRLEKRVRKLRGFFSSPRLHLEELEARLAPANITWTGGAGTFNWGDAQNWFGGVVPGASDNAIINIVVSSPITITGTQSINSLTDTTASLVLSSG